MANWHPILNAREGPVATWTMIGPLEKPYAVVALVKRGDELGYQAVSVASGNAPEKLIGYFRSLVAATKAAHTWFTSTSGPHGIPHAGWLGKQPQDRA